MTETRRIGVRWRILAGLFAMAFLAYLFRYNLSVAAPSIQRELGLTSQQLALVLSPFIWGYTLCQFPGGLLGQRFGARRALTWMIAAWAAITLACGILPGAVLRSAGAALAGLLVLRFALGAAQGPLFPAQAGAIQRWFPVGRWALPNSLASVGATLGAALTPPLVAWLVVRFGWRQSFYLTAPLGVVMAALWWWYARDDPAAHPGVNAAERALIAAGKGVTEDEGSGFAWPLLRNRQVLLLTASYFCMNYVWYIYFSWLFVYLLEERGFSMLESGVMAALPWLAGSVGAAAGGVACERLCSRLGPRLGCRVPAIAGLVAVAGLLSGGAYARGPYVAVALLSLCYAANQFTEGAYWQGISYLAGSQTAASSGILNTGGNLAGIVATPLTAWLFSAHGWLAALATGSLFSLAGALLWLWIRTDPGLAPPAPPPPTR